MPMNPIVVPISFAAYESVIMIGLRAVIPLYVKPWITHTTAKAMKLPCPAIASMRRSTPSIIPIQKVVLYGPILSEMKPITTPPTPAPILNADTRRAAVAAVTPYCDFARADISVIRRFPII